MHPCNSTIISPSWIPNNCYLTDKIAGSKYFVANPSHIYNFRIVKTNKDNSILRHQILCHSQPRINHIQPIGMKPPVALRVLHQPVALLVVLPAVGDIAIRILGKIVLIDKIVPRVVGRIDINHLHLAQIRFPQQLQNIEVVALDVKVLAVPAAGRAIPAHAVFAHGAQRRGNGCVCRQHGLPLVRPGELIALLTTLHHAGVDFLHEYILINGADNFARFGIDGFRHRIGKQRRQLFIILIREIGGVHVELIHIHSPHRAVRRIDVHRDLFI